MPKGTNQKLKLYYLAKIMLEKTDDEHMITMPEIKKALEEYDITADRKSLYDDIATLEKLGIKVEGEKEGKGYYYHVASKHFEIAELKLLVDSIQSSKFITAKKSNELIKKLTAMASKHEASQLKRQVVVQGRVKTMNESIYYIVDNVHRAIAESRQIRFDYMKWNEEKKMVRRKEVPYIVSPWALTWSDENYYMIAYNAMEEKIKHYRVDKLRNVEILPERRIGLDKFKEYDLARYTKMSFGMFGGDPTWVKIAFENEKAGIFIDRFGREISIHPSDREGWSEIHVEVALSDQFLGWIFAIGSGVKILGPDEVVEAFRKKLKEMAKEYK